jgi:protein-tyrosine phosphatase
MAFDDELPELYAAGIRAVVSLLNIPSDGPVYEAAGFSFLCLPIADGAPPTLEQTVAFVHFVDEQRNAQRPLAVHCEAGLGRTGTMLAAYLIAHGAGASEAILRVRAVQRFAIETSRQIQFLQELSEHRQEFFPGRVGSE